MKFDPRKIYITRDGREFSFESYRVSDRYPITGTIIHLKDETKVHHWHSWSAEGKYLLGCEYPLDLVEVKESWKARVVRYYTYILDKLGKKK